LNNTALIESEDPHTWLNPEIAASWLEIIASAVATADESNRQHYLENAKKAIADIAQLHIELRAKLHPARNMKFIVQHDAYQHLAKGFGLTNPHPIALSDARSPGAASILKLRKTAATADCAFSEHQHDDSIVDTVINELDVKRGILDPTGSRLEPGPSLYASLLSNLADDLLTCFHE